VGDGRPGVTAPRRLAVFDLDGTLTRADTFGPFVLGLLARHPLRAWRLPLLLIPVVAYLLRLTGRGGLKGSVIHLLFGGMARARVDAWADEYSALVVPRRMFADAVHALRAHLSDGDHVVVLSASPDLYVPRIGAALGAHESICSEVRWNGDRLDGRLAGENRRGQEKLRVLRQLREAHPGLPVTAYGNSDPDLPHLLQADQAVYVNPAATLEQKLSARGLRCVQWQ
jgi:phosphatidylglycerophosphatase C